MCSKSSVNGSVSFSIASSFYQDFIFIFMSASGVSHHQVLRRCLVNKQGSPGSKKTPPLFIGRGGKGASLGLPSSCAPAPVSHLISSHRIFALEGA